MGMGIMGLGMGMGGCYRVGMAGELSVYSAVAYNDSVWVQPLHHGGGHVWHGWGGWFLCWPVVDQSMALVHVVAQLWKLPGFTQLALVCLLSASKLGAKCLTVVPVLEVYNWIHGWFDSGWVVHPPPLQGWHCKCQDSCCCSGHSIVVVVKGGVS